MYLFNKKYFIKVTTVQVGIISTRFERSRALTEDGGGSCLDRSSVSQEGKDPFNKSISLESPASMASTASTST